MVYRCDFTGETRETRLENKMPAFSSAEHEQIVSKCTACGVCAAKCPVVGRLGLTGGDPKTVQEAVTRCLQTGEPTDIAYQRAFSCMSCFKCVFRVCPEGLNPMKTNEVVKALYRRRSPEVLPPEALDVERPDRPGDARRVLAALQTTEAEFRRIFAKPDKSRAEYVFFPGCNVYAQPHLLLDALDVIDRLGEDVVLLPGLDDCCGDGALFFGDPRAASEYAKRLTDRIAAFAPKAVLFWCPTCLCRFGISYKSHWALPFEVVSFPRFLADRLDLLSLKSPIRKTVTLHEACKAAYTGMDLNGVRDILAGVSGIELIEMPRSGKKAACCGSGAASWFPGIFSDILDERLAEAEKTGAADLIDVCHFCHEVFLHRTSEAPFAVRNYISVVAEAAGLEPRTDEFGHSCRKADAETIMAKLEQTASAALFSRERIMEVLTVRCGFEINEQ